MGKSKHKRNKSSRPQPTGLLSMNDDDIQEEMTDVALASSISNLIEKLQSTSEEERECTCTIIASLVEQKGAVLQLMHGKVVRVLGPQLVSGKWSLQQAALGALRNISVEGGSSVCEEMIAQDVMTPLVAFFQKFQWDSTEKDNSRSVVFEQALHLLWNLCEASDIAVKIFNQQNLLQVLLLNISPESHGSNIALAAAQCLYAVSDSNAQLAADLSVSGGVTQMEAMLTQPHSTSEQLLLQVLISGILYNTSVNVCSALHQALVSVLSVALEQDLSALLSTLDTRLTSVTLPAEMANGAAAAVVADGHEEEMECPLGIEKENTIRHSAIEECLQQAEQLAHAQCIAVQLIANMCCSNDDDDGEGWDDMSDTSPDDDAMDSADASDNLLTWDSLSLPSELHSAFADKSIPQKVLNKVMLPDEALCSRLVAHRKTARLMKSVSELHVGILLCLSNVIAVLDEQMLGSGIKLSTVLSGLAEMANTERVQSHAELLEAVTSAMQTTMLKLARTDAKQLNMTQSEMQFLFTLSKSSDMNVRANMVRTVSGVGQALAKQSQPHPMIKPVGQFLMQVALSDNTLWLVAEAVDAIMDVFAEDHLNSVIAELNLLPQLVTLRPKLKVKGRERAQLGEHLPVVMTVRDNLPRFIHYKTKMLAS